MAVTGRAAGNDLNQIKTPLKGNSVLIVFPMLNTEGLEIANMSTISRGTPYHHDRYL